MKKIYIIATYVFCFGFIFFQNCENNEVDKNEVEPDDPVYPNHYLSADDSLEAFELALFMDQSLLPCKTTIEFQLYHINYLRQTWRDSLPFISIRFLTPWKIGEVGVKFDSATADLIQSGQYQGISMLPDSLRPDSFEMPDQLGLTLFHYDEKYHPICLSEIISDLPGVIYAEPNGRTFAGFATYPILPGMIDENAAYIIVLPLNRVEHYFRYENGKPKYYGTVSAITDSLILAEIESVRTQFEDKKSGLN